MLSTAVGAVYRRTPKTRTSMPHLQQYLRQHETYSSSASSRRTAKHLDYTPWRHNLPTEKGRFRVSGSVSVEPVERSAQLIGDPGMLPSGPPWEIESPPSSAGVGTSTWSGAASSNLKDAASSGLWPVRPATTAAESTTLMVLASIGSVSVVISIGITRDGCLDLGEVGRSAAAALPCLVRAPVSQAPRRICTEQEGGIMNEI